MRMCHVILWLSLIFLHIDSWRARFYRFFNKMFLLHLQFLSESFLVVSTIQRHVTIALNWSSSKLQVCSVIFYWNLDFLNTCWKNFRTTKSIKIRPLQAEVFDAVRHDEAYAYSHFSQFWERAENIPDKTYVKPLPNTVPDSVELVRFYTRIYQLPLQWGYSINCIEESGINGNNWFKYIYVICMCVGMYVSK